MISEHVFLNQMFDELEQWVHLLPPQHRRKVKLAAAIYHHHGSAPSELFAKEVGGVNWVLHSRTRRIVEKYGKDVICLTPKQYESAMLRAFEKMVSA